MADSNLGTSEAKVYSPYWIQTYTGKVVDLYDPDPPIDPEDIAHALSNICRFTGHCNRFYSVAEHSVFTMQALVASGETDVMRLKWALLHDATEAYLCDIARPFKHLVGDKYRDFDSELEWSILQRFGIDLSDQDREVVKEADIRMLATEREQIMGPCEREWGSLTGYQPYDLQLKCLPPKDAKWWFVDVFEGLFPDVQYGSEVLS